MTMAAQAPSGNTWTRQMTADGAFARQPGVAATVDLDHVRHHYYGSHKHINPSELIPQGA
jgi:putative glutathione S-transferase